MSTLSIVLAILLFISAIFLIVAVLMQSGKDKGTGVVTGGSSETYFGKNKSKSKEKKLALITTIVAIIFVVLAIVAYVTQEYNPAAPNTNTGSTTSSSGKNSTADVKPASSTASSSSTDTKPASSK